MSKKIRGTAEFQKLEGGFWSIRGEDGEQYRPVNMPEQFKENGLQIECRIEVLEDTFSMIMWGTEIRIVSFKTSI